MEDPERVRQVVTPALKRRRPALSCAECRRRKIKCDRKHPCDPCKRFESPTCTYNSKQINLTSSVGHVSLSTSSPSPSSTRDSPNDEGIAASNVEQLAPIAPSTVPGSTTHIFEQPSLINRIVGAGNYDNLDLTHRIERLEQIQASAKLNEQAVEPGSSLPAHSSRLEGIMLKNRYFGHSHWLSAIAKAKSFMCFDNNKNVDGVVKMKNSAVESSINASIQSCKVMSKAIKAAQYPQWTIQGITFQHNMPIRSVADELVRHYLRTHESTYRILHIPSFQQEYRQYWTDPQTTSTVSLMKIVLVMAIGTCFSQSSEFDALKTQAIQWIHIAQSWLAGPKEKTRFNTAAVQVECLLFLARSVWDMGTHITWSHTGNLLRTAMGMGFHRDPKHFKRFSVLHSEVRRRLWATILEINIQASLDSGMAAMISPKDFDTEPPSNINDDEINESVTTHPPVHPSHVFTQSSMQIELLRSLATRLEVAQFGSNCRIEPSYEEIIQLDKELLQLYKGGHSKFARAAQDDSAKFRPTALHRKMFDLKFQGSLLVLHRPYAMEAREHAHFYYSHKIYLDTALAVHSTPPKDLAATYESMGYEVEDDYARLCLIGGGSIKEILIQSVIIIYQEMIAPLEEDLPGFFREERRSIREPYLHVLREMMHLSYKRLEAGETAVKSHLTYSVAFAHINALENGTSPEEAMIEAATLSLSEARAILKRRVPFMPAALGNSFEDGISDMSCGDLDLTMPDWGMEFEASNSWLFSGWALTNSGDLEF